MRKIITKEQIEKTNKRKQLILGVILIFLLIFSTAGFSWLSKDNETAKGIVTEKGFKFYNQNGFWLTQIDNKVFSFSYLPSEVENISVKGFYNLNDYTNQILYFNRFDEGANEILSNINTYILRYQKACADETCEEDIPTKDCTNNFIIFIDGNSSIYKEENCVYIIGEQKKGADAFLYKILNIQ
jgi:hypothetical protein